MIPAIFGLSGHSLTSEEKEFFRSCDPAGFILFGRNVADREQLRALTDSLRALSGRQDLAILIDQEGGRVERLKPPEWPSFPAAWRFAELYAKAPISAIEAARANAEAIATILFEAGINVDCAPVLDIRSKETHPAIGDRALGSDPLQVAALGRAILQGLEAGGVVGLVKHMPGHGRARADSHDEMPVAEATGEELETDIAPFRALNDAAMGMTSHLLYPAWDELNPASLSSTIIGDIIRGQIGFDGLLLSDDLAMGALSGRLGERAVRAIAAGCDVALHCSGVLSENEEVAAALGAMSEVGSKRLEKALARVAGISPGGDFEGLLAKRDALLTYA